MVFSFAFSAKRGYILSILVFRALALSTRGNRFEIEKNGNDIDDDTFHISGNAPQTRFY